MTKYTGKILRAFFKKITVIAASPAAEHLFNFRDDKDTKYLLEDQSKSFRHTIAQIIFMSSREHRDVQIAVEFFTTRVKNPKEDDCGKLKRVCKYLNGTIYMKLKLMVENMSLIR